MMQPSINGRLLRETIPMSSKCGVVDLSFVQNIE